MRTRSILTEQRDISWYRNLLLLCLRVQEPMTLDTTRYCYPNDASGVPSCVLQGRLATWMRDREAALLSGPSPKP